MAYSNWEEVVQMRGAGIAKLRWASTRRGVEWAKVVSRRSLYRKQVAGLQSAKNCIDRPKLFPREHAHRQLC